MAVSEKSFLNCIGHTPMLEATKLSPNPAVRIFLKLEGFNASGSVKDRPALYMVRDAIASGRLKPGMTILDATSGNYGIALSMIGKCEGYPVTLVASQNITEERKKLLHFYGTKIVYIDSTYTKDSIECARKLVEQDSSYCYLFQHGNLANAHAHYETTGVEVVEQVPEIDALVCGLGSSGTLMGTGKRVREHNERAKIVSVEPRVGSRIPGLRNLEAEGYSPPLFDPSFPDHRLQVLEKDARAMIRTIAHKEGVFIGISAGAVLHAAVQVASSMKSGSIVAVLADAGWKYMSVGICEDEDAS
jgi:cysteine synthase